MLSTKKLLYKIVDYLSYKSASVTKVGNVWTNGSITAYKSGGAVTLKLSGAAFSTVSARTQIGTVPAGFRPATQSYGLDSTGVYVYLVEASGGLYIEKDTGGHTLYGTLTYAQRY